MAWHEKANLFISLHCDACADGQDPREIQGFSACIIINRKATRSHPHCTTYTRRTQRHPRRRVVAFEPGGLPSHCRCRLILFEQAFLILPEYDRTAAHAETPENGAKAEKHHRRDRELPGCAPEIK